MIKFLHIPKTAGTSIQKAIAINSLGHLKLSQVKGEIFFACSRNPYDRACSVFYFLNRVSVKMPEINKRDKSLFPIMDAAKTMSLVDFWQHIQKNGAPERARLIHRQIDFLRDKPGVDGISPRIKHLIRFETLAEDWPAFAEKNGFAELQHLNKSERLSPWQDEMTPELVAIINELYADDFEHLNYERIS